MLQEVKSINAPLHWDPGPSNSQSPPAVPPSNHQKPARGPHKPESGSHSLGYVVPWPRLRRSATHLCHFQFVLGILRLLSSLLHRRVFLTRQPELLQTSTSTYDDAIFWSQIFPAFCSIFLFVFTVFFLGIELELRAQLELELDSNLFEPSSSSEAKLDSSLSLGQK